MGKAVANEQVFQSIYVDYSKKKWMERIVFLDQMFDSLPQSVIPLKSAMVENKPSIVISGPKIEIVKFRNKIHDLDSETILGKKSIEEILQSIVDTAKTMRLSVEYLNKITNPTVADISFRYPDVNIYKHGNNYVFGNSIIVNDDIVGYIDNKYEYRIGSGLDNIKEVMINRKFVPIALSNIEVRQWLSNIQDIANPVLNISTTIKKVSPRFVLSDLAKNNNFVTIMGFDDKYLTFSKLQSVYSAVVEK